MAKGWHRESRRHALASKGIKTAVDNKPIDKIPQKKYAVLINPKGKKEDEKYFIGGETETEARRKAKDWGLNPDTVFKNTNDGQAAEAKERMKQKSFDRDLENMANNLMSVKEQKDEENRNYSDKQIQKIFDKWEEQKIPQWKRGLIFDRVEDFIEDKNSSLSKLKKDSRIILQGDL